MVTMVSVLGHFGVQGTLQFLQCDMFITPCI